MNVGNSNGGEQSAQNGNLQNKLLGGVLFALLGLGGMEGVGYLRGGNDPTARSIEDVHDIVTRTDATGLPLVYSPRELVEGQRALLKVLEEIREELRKR